jgi:hypothetical protein
VHAGSTQYMLLRSVEAYEMLLLGKGLPISRDVTWIKVRYYRTELDCDASHLNLVQLEYSDVTVLRRGVGEVRVVARGAPACWQAWRECSIRKNSFITEFETSARTESKQMTNHNTPQLSQMDLANHCAAFPGLSLLNTRAVVARKDSWPWQRSPWLKSFVLSGKRYRNLPGYGLRFLLFKWRQHISTCQMNVDGVCAGSRVYCLLKTQNYK